MIHNFFAFLKWRSQKSWYCTCKLGLCWRDGLVFWIRYFLSTYL